MFPLSCDSKVLQIRQYGRDGYLQTLIDNQQNRFIISEKSPFCFAELFSRLSFQVALTSLGFVEFYITDFWIEE